MKVMCKVLKQSSAVISPISRMSLEFFCRFDKLVHLNLDENKITKLNMRSFTEMKSLQFLSLDGNYLEDLPDEAFQNLHHVRRLNLAYNQLKKLNFQVSHVRLMHPLQWERFQLYRFWQWEGIEQN